MQRSLLPLFALAALPASGAAQHTIRHAAWLVGCWEQRTGERLRVERWYEPTDGAMRGTSRSFNGATETAGERLQLTVDSGVLVYAAHPSSQAPAEFRATTVHDSALVFENPEHDFPQRIAYRPVGTDSLLVQVDGDRDGRRRPLIFRFRRGSCAPGEAPADAIQEALLPAYAALERRMMASANAFVGWIVEHADSGFAYQSWATGGYLARSAPFAAFERAAQANSPPPAGLAEVRIDALLPMGDTAEVLVATRQQWAADSAGTRPSRTLVQRRIDRWVRAGDRWRLTNMTIFGEDFYENDRLERRDGRLAKP